MNIKRKIIRKISIFLINKFFAGTHFFAVKRKLLELSDITIGRSKVVGPIRINSEVELIIGDDCWIGREFSIEGNGIVEIGNKIDLGPCVMCLTGSHQIGLKTRRAGTGITGKVIIEDGSWIGARAMILPNIVINKMAVVGAGTLVKRDVEENTLVCGVPGKAVRKL